MVSGVDFQFRPIAPTSLSGNPGQFEGGYCAMAMTKSKNASFNSYGRFASGEQSDEIIECSGAAADPPTGMTGSAARPQVNLQTVHEKQQKKVDKLLELWSSPEVEVEASLVCLRKPLSAAQLSCSP